MLRTTSTRTITLLAGGLAAAALLLALLPAFAEEDGKPRLKVDAKQLVYAENCRGCHHPQDADYWAWTKTKHFKSRDVLEGARAGAIAEKLGIDDATADSVCVTCHGTPKIVDNSVELHSGVSCEMCHGAAKQWYKVHGDKQIDRKQRFAAAIAAGMIRPGKLYTLASNCMGCHSVPRERLVNLGGHPAGSQEFELVAWSQGEIRHNLNVHKGRKTNDESPIERRRMMYVVGQLVSLEFGLSGLSLAQADGAYARAMTARIDAAVKQIKAVSAAVKGVTLHAKVTAALSGVALKPGNAKALGEAAGKIAALGRKWASGKPDLSGIDSMLPKTYRGTPYIPNK